MSKIVTDFFGLTTPDEEKKEENETVNEEKKDNNDTSVDNLEKNNVSNSDTNESNKDDIQNTETSDVEEGEIVEEEDDDEDDDDDDDDDDDLQKLEWAYEEKNTLLSYHPEVTQISEEELQTLSTIVKDKNGNIVDPFHKTIPIMTKYEKAKIIGIRAQQINSGSEPFIQIDNNMIDGLTIANEELIKKKIPFIIRRPLPNGSSEYWNINDLELLE
tara:strand:+ start:519 stop:1166 length:648 start_codon:yes stop_codon:yes gene_type:complete